MDMGLALRMASKNAQRWGDRRVEVPVVFPAQQHIWWGGVLATTGVSELPSYFSKNNDCEKKIILCKAKICWVHQACQKSATLWHLLRSIQLLPVTRSSPLRHHLTHTLCSAVRKWNSRDLLQWLTSRDYPGLSVLFRSHASPAPYLPSCRWAGSRAGSGEPAPNTSHRAQAAAPAACALAHTEVFFLNQLYFSPCYQETGMFVIMSGEN